MSNYAQFPNQKLLSGLYFCKTKSSNFWLEKVRIIDVNISRGNVNHLFVIPSHVASYFLSEKTNVGQKQGHLLLNHVLSNISL